MKKLLLALLFAPLTAWAGIFAYGDSLSTNTGASSPSNGFLPLLSTALGTAITNNAVSGAQAADQAVAAKSRAPVAGDKFIVEIGTNDAQWYGTDTAKREYFRRALGSLLVWNATPAKTLGTAGTFAGSWPADAYSAGVGVLALYTGDTATYTASGTAIYVSMKFYSGGYGAAEILVDGVVKATVTTPNPGFSTKNNSYPLDQVGMIRIAGLSPGSHSVQVKVIPGSGSPQVIYLQWVAGSDQVTRPPIYVVKLHKWSAAAYATFGGSDANIDAYNAIIASVVAELVADGHNIVIVDTGITLADLAADGVHWADAGHLKAKNALYSAMSGPPPPPPTYSPAQIVIDAAGNFFGQKLDGSATKLLSQ